MSLVLRQLQHRADDLAECLLIFELEMKRSRTLAQRLEAFHDFAQVVNRIDVLRRDAEESLHSQAKDSMLRGLDRQAASIMRTPAYRVAEWFESQGATLGWFVGPEVADPLHQFRLY